MKRWGGIRIGDVFLMALIAVLALAIGIAPLLRPEHALTAEIVLARSGEVRHYSIAQDGTYEIMSDGYSLTVVIASESICVERSDCRDQICVHSRAISRPGQSIVCAPAGVAIRIIGEGAGLDGISG